MKFKVLSMMVRIFLIIILTEVVDGATFLDFKLNAEHVEKLTWKSYTYY